MAGFRVAEHDQWRNATPRHEGPATKPPAPEPIDESANLRRRVEALGPIGYPARLYDGVFGRWSGRSRLFLVLRFLLVVFTVVLLVGGVNGESLIQHEVGAYRTVDQGDMKSHFLTSEGSQRYVVKAAVGLPHQVVAHMGGDHGTVRVPNLGTDGPEAYGLQVKLVRGAPGVHPELGLQTPDGYIARTIRPTSDDGITVRYGIIPLDAPGGYKFVLRSAEGSGRVDLHVAVASAAVNPVEQFRPDWIPLFGGMGLGTLLVGAYTPGAATLAQLRRRRSDGDTPYRMAEYPATFYDRVVPVHELDEHPDAKLAYRDE